MLLLVAIISLSGCAATQTAATQTHPLRFSHDDLVITATRSGCAIRNFSITNSGTTEKKAHGEINVLDSAKSNELTVYFNCPTVYPNGQSECTAYVTRASKGNSGGPGCPNFSEFRSKINAF